MVICDVTDVFFISSYRNKEHDVKTPMFQTISPEL